MTKAVVDTMLESMKKNLKENMEVIQGLENPPP